MSQLVFSLHQNPEEVGSNASEGMDLLGRLRASRQGESFLLPCPHIGVVQIKGGSSHLKDLELSWIFTLQVNYLRKK